MQVLVTIGDSFREAFFMFWQTLWALVLGFGLAGAVQAFVARGQMQRVMGDHRPAALARASLLGAASSSCSYAASALARSLFRRGADFTAAMVFMFASTNLVLELGIVLWLLVGWRFTAAESVGGAIMIVLLGLLLPRLVPRAWIEQARHRRDAHEPPAEEADDPEPLRQRLRRPARWADAAGYTIADLTMLRREIVIGFVAAGFAARAIPVSFWNIVFLHGHGTWTMLENAAVGPFVAIISFVCSIGNVPLAAALWQDGISFGGVVAFIFADLITLPLLLVYRKLYGGRLTWRLLPVFWLIMSVAGLATELIFRAAGIMPTRHHFFAVTERLRWDTTTILNLVFLVVFAGLYWLHRNKRRFGGGQDVATDPVCGMQVDKANPGAVRREHGHTVYFCSPHCADRYHPEPSSPAGTGPRACQTGA